MQFSHSTMTPAEAELLIRELQPFRCSDIGSEKWKNQRTAVERLNMCTHSNAVRKVDDYVKTFLVEQEKLTTVLHELLLMEVWRQKVVDADDKDNSESAAQLREAIATNPTAAYMYCSYESVLLNLLECIAFYEETVTSLGDDVLELIDYCWRQVYYLFSLEKELSQTQELDEETTGPAAVAKMDPVKRLLELLKDQRLSRAMSCLSILWFVVDRLDSLPLSVSNNVLNKNDLLLGLSEVLVLQPWQRRVSKKGDVRFQKYKNGSFTDVDGDDRLVVCTPEAHAWFCIHKLLCDPEIRRRYQYTAHKKEIILKVRRFMNETLIDQIPALASVQRALEELSFLEPPSGTEEKFKSNHLIIIEHVPRIMTAVTEVDRAANGADWREKERARLTAMLRDRSVRAQDAMRMGAVFDELFSGEA